MLVKASAALSKRNMANSVLGVQVVIGAKFLSAGPRCVRSLQCATHAGRDGETHSKQEPLRVSAGSLQERQHSLLRPCYYPVLANGRMLCVFLNFVKSCAFFSNLVQIGSATWRSLPVFLPVTREAGL